MAPIDDEYSPLLLINTWPKNSRVVLLMVCSLIGIIINGFFVASFFIDKILRRRGNVYLACAGIPDLFITAGVIPTCVVVLISGQMHTDPVCSAVHFLGVASTYNYNMIYMLVAMESYYRHCRTAEEYAALIKANIVITTICVFLLSFMVAAVGVYLEMDYNYCTRATYGNIYFRVGTAILFQVIPFLITIFGLICAFIAVRRRARKKVTYKRSLAFVCDRSNTTVNISAYLIFVMIWIPYLVIVYKFPNITNPYYYISVWIGLSRSIFTTGLYALMNRVFCNTYGRLYRYCFCKKSLSNSFKRRNRRKVNYRTANRDTRVHNVPILQQESTINVHSPPRYSSSSRITTGL